MIFPKNGFALSTRPRLVSPESSPPKRDTTFVVIWSNFLHEKSHKVNKIDDFVILCDHQLFQHDHVQFTFEDHRILQNPHQSLNYVFGKYIKKYKNKPYFAHQESEKRGHFCPKPVQLGERHRVS